MLVVLLIISLIIDTRFFLSLNLSISSGVNTMWYLNGEVLDCLYSIVLMSNPDRT